MADMKMQEITRPDGTTFMAPVPAQPQEGAADNAAPADVDVQLSLGEKRQQMIRDGVSPEPHEQGWVSRSLEDIAVGVVGGARDGVQEVGETIQWAGESIGNAITGGHDVYYTKDDGFEWLTEEEVMGRDDVPEWQTRDLIGETLKLPEVPDNETVAGGLTRGVTQFLAGYGVAGKALKSVKAATKTGAAAKAMGQGAVADVIAFDAHEERFSDFLRENTGLADPITEYLSADEDDSVLEGKLKNAIEGLGLGVAADGLFRLASAFKRAKKVRQDQGPEKAAEVMNDAVEELADEGQLDLFDSTTDPNMSKDAPAGPEKVVVNGREGKTPEAPVQASEPAPAPVTRSNADAQTETRLQPQKPVDVKAFQEAIDNEVGMVKAGSMPDPNRHLTGSLFNFDKMDADVSTLDYLNMASDAIPESALQDRTTFDKMNEDARGFLADSIDVSPEVIDASLANMAKGMKKQQGVVIAGKQLVQSLAREVENLAYKISEGNASDADYAKMVRLQSRVIEVSGNLKSVITGAAQTTASGRIITSDVVTGNQLAQSDITKQLLDQVDQAGGRDAVRKLADEIMLNKQAGNGVRGTMRVTADRNPTTFWGVVNEVRINGLLSGPRTHVINNISNGIQAFLLPGEKILGGAMRLDPARMREGARQYVGIAAALKDATKFAGMAFKRGRGILDPEAAILEANGADFRAIQSQSENPYVRNLVNGLGSVIRMPSRALLTSDEFFKQINYRSNLQARLQTQVSELVANGQVAKKDAAKWVADRMKAGVGSQGQAVSKESIDYAREATFTNELRKGSMPRSVQDMTNKHPYLKTILPFVRTPTNLIVAAAQRTPLLHRASKNMMDDLNSGDPSRVAQAKGKLATGSMLWGTAVTAALEGKITGSGPVDPAQKSLLMETGWRPYSVKVGDKYVSYERLDPFAMFFGIAADFADISGQVGEEEAKKVAVAGFAAIANNLASKTWLSGLTDAVDAFANPEIRGESYLQSLTTSFLPYSSLAREGRKFGDDAMRDTKGDPNASFWEMQSILNAVKNTVPGHSQDLPARRSWITGEPITYPKGWGKDMVTPLGEAFASVNPIYEGEWKKDPVLDELANLEFGLSAPTRKIKGVDLTPDQYEVYLELHGKVRAPGTRRTMYQELGRLFQNKSYDVNRERAPNFSDPSMDPRIKAVRRITTAYRQLAQQELLQRFPELRAKIGDAAREAQQNQRSMLTGITDLAD
ncbi:hypothetical protein MHM88_11305 [Epibacterium sp. MM17-32]|uniref:hypothetical protein n=1 Tax=Epibacterium sp. MM17-32 TaxID=2917734 RepID=UPI001EF53F5E|nr:hypothetical protein [Epibacterium sp. MM17-32]MCG7628395.1 hypothetical protein [Epibacterium sp. MM17-32]